MPNTIEQQDTRELNRIWDWIDPWLEHNIDREPFTITLKSGNKYDFFMPLGAAVELEEEHGYSGRIVWGLLPPEPTDVFRRNRGYDS